VINHVVASNWHQSDVGGSARPDMQKHIGLDTDLAANGSVATGD